jgi:hypothetical protein
MKTIRLLLLLFFLGLFTLNSLGQAIGDYKSAIAGTWGTRANWLRWSGTAWVVPTAGQGAPTSASGVITITHIMTVAAAVTLDQVVNGGGIIINSGITVTVNNGIGNDITNNGSITNSGTVIINGQIVNNGTYNENYWTYTNNAAATITNSATFNFNIGANGELDIITAGSSFTNNGTISNNGLVIIDATLNNNGTYNERNATQVGYGANGILNNNAGATLNIQSTGALTGGQLGIGSSANIYTGTINNSGSIINNCPDPTYPGIYVDYGTINNSNVITNNAGTTFYNGEYGYVYVNNTFNNYGIYVEHGTTRIGYNVSGGVFNNYAGATYTLYDVLYTLTYGPELTIGKFSSSRTGTFYNYGTLTNNMSFFDATYAYWSDITIDLGTLNNTGTINNNGGDWYYSNGAVVFYKYGILCQHAASSIVNTGTINNNAAFEVSTSAILNNNTLGIYNNNAFTVVEGGVLNNFSTYNENLETFNSTNGTINNRPLGNINISATSLICFSNSGAVLTNYANGTITNLGVTAGFPGLMLNVTGTSLTNNGTIIDKGNIYNKGTFTNNATFDYYMSNGSITGTQNFVYGAPGILIYHATSAQTTSNFEFPPAGVPFLIINNASSTGVTMSKPGTVSNKMTLMDGLLYSDATNILTMADNATVSTDGVNAEPGSAISFVNGPVKKTGAVAFTFPLGDVSGTNVFVWAPVGIASHLASDITAEYYFVNYGNNLGAANMCNPATLDHVSGIEHWLLNSNNAFPAVTLYWKDAARSNITNPNDLVVSHWEPCSGPNKWANMGGSVTDNAGSGYVTSTIALTSYSPFTFGTKNNTNPLPVNLLSFFVECDNGKVTSKWSTMTETNNDHFTIEKSIDAENWSVVANIPGGGNSNEILNYQFTDERSLPGISYYRLKQTDFNGKNETFNPVSVICSSSETVDISMYPNPFKGELIIEYSNLIEGTAVVKVYNMMGKMILNYSIEVSNGSNDYIVDLRDMAVGLYNVEFTSGDTHYHQKMIKN